jgi:predicted lipid-binding transport protein (Tim44 family)
MTAAGDFTCLGGEMTGLSICYDSSDTDLSVKEVEMISSVLRATFDLAGVSMDEAKAAISKSLSTALGVDLANVIVNGITKVARRLDASSQRRLAAAAYDISYGVIVPDGMDPSSLMSKATDIATPGSAVSAAFTSAMQSESLPVSDIELISAPQRSKTTVVIASDGSIVTPAPSVKTDTGSSTGEKPAPAPAEESGGGGMGAIIGGIVGGLFGLGIVGFLVYWFVLRKKSQQE